MNKSLTILCALLLPLAIGAADSFSTANVHAPAANTAAIVTYAADANKRHGVRGVHWSYNAAPTGGNLKIEDGAGNIVYSVDITAAGPGPLNYNIERLGTAGRALIVTLAAGGAGVTGKVNVLYYGTQ